VQHRLHQDRSRVNPLKDFGSGMALKSRWWWDLTTRDFASLDAERTVVITYLQGVRPGIYRFRGGRLVSVERVPEQSTPKPEKKKPSKSKERAAAGT